MVGVEYYALELTTPPLPLVALLGQPAIHQMVGEFLKNRFNPPMNSIGIADPGTPRRVQNCCARMAAASARRAVRTCEERPSRVAAGDALLLFGERKERLSSGSSSGILLKSNWLQKHRLRKVRAAISSGGPPVPLLGKHNGLPPRWVGLCGGGVHRPDLGCSGPLVIPPGVRGPRGGSAGGAAPWHPGAGMRHHPGPPPRGPARGQGRHHPEIRRHRSVGRCPPFDRPNLASDVPLASAADPGSLISLALGAGSQALERLGSQLSLLAASYYGAEVQRAGQQLREDMGHERAVRIYFKASRLWGEPPCAAAPSPSRRMPASRSPHETNADGDV